MTTTHTPESVRELARAALVPCPDCGVVGCLDAPAYEDFIDVVTRPEILTALVDRLERVHGCHGCGCDDGGSDPMTTPLLTPNPGKNDE